MATRKYVFLDPVVIEVGHITLADEMQQHDAVIRQQVAAFFKKGVVEANTHMLEHADGNNAFKRARRAAVVLQAVLKPFIIFQARCRGNLFL